jgi:polysaccharide biosynthesis protein PslG
VKPGRRRRRASVAVLALLVTAGCGSASSSDDTTGNGPDASVPAGFWGVNVDSTLTLTPEDYSRMQSAGVRTLRVQFFWPAIQSQRGGSFSWTHTDGIVSQAAQHGIQVLPVLYGTPAFETGCTSRDCQIKLPTVGHQERLDWVAFVQAAARRYGPRGLFWSQAPTLPYKPISAWQVWNEPNNFTAGGQPRSTPAEYADLVKLTKNALTVVDPESKLLLAGMFGTPNGSNDPDISAWGVLHGIYRAGAGSDFDGVAIHPYATDVAGVSSQIARLHRVIARNGPPGGVPIYVTEIGWGSDAPNTDHFLVETVQGQEEKLREAFSMLLRNRARWDIAGVDWYSWRDPPAGTGLCGFCYSAGLYTAEGTPKPALAAYQEFALGKAGSG